MTRAGIPTLLKEGAGKVEHTSNALWKEIEKQSGKLKFQKELTDYQTRYVQKAEQSLQEKGLGKRGQKHQRFLDNVLIIHTGYFRLCAILFKPSTLFMVPQPIIDCLLDTIRNNKVDHTRLNHIAKLPFSLSGNALSSTDHTHEESTSTELSNTANGHHRSPGRSSEQQEFNNASLQGIGMLFSDSICDEIRKVTVDGCTKAAVTMTFPLWAGPVGGLMSLDVREQGIELLTLALFGIKMKWTDQDLYIIQEGGWSIIIAGSEITFKGIYGESESAVEVKWMDRVLRLTQTNGMSMTVTDSDITLSGVSDAVVDKVFGSEIQSTITACPLRNRELMAGQLATGCVSMNVTKHGAIINLSLGLDGAHQMRNKLYT